MIQNRLIKNNIQKLSPGLIYQRLSYLFIGILLALIFRINSYAQTGSVQSLDINIKNNHILTGCHLKHNFIDDDLKQTLSSGMSSTFNFQINLKYENGSIIRSQLKEISVRYDIWEKQFLLYSNDHNKQFPDFKTFESFLYDSLSFDLGSVKGINNNKPIRVIVFFSPEKISSAQKEKLNYWLTSNADTRESSPGMEPESGFSIDLSKLFSVFLSDKTEKNIQQFKSEPFTIENLRKNEKPAQ